MTYSNDKRMKQRLKELPHYRNLVQYFKAKFITCVNKTADDKNVSQTFRLVECEILTSLLLSKGCGGDY